jgi:hypothetical protein
MRMPFGKYRGELLARIPEDYLRWVLEHADPDWRLRDAIQASLRARAWNRARSGRGDGSAPTRTEKEYVEAMLKGFDRIAEYRQEVQVALKTTYRELALRHHPDRGGSHEAMVAVNEMYERLNELLQMRVVPPT